MSCPICHKATDQKFRPFCSKRCADIDLGKWLTGKYAIAMENSDEDQAAEEPQPKPH